MGGRRRWALAGREPSGRAWVKSSYSGNQTECVEMVLAKGHTLVRDSKWSGDDGGGDVLAFRREPWCGFLAGLVDPEAGGS
ncbi:DUF397 domain-containing protein [Streptomyces sp. NTH33]|uniref:DUF397 domain-containing protein n=1 Tax=Streptomyces sp. NTH33 TaxID=1735453 RepID=UPI000DA7A8C7|nr:DUF397 domain-containing protein [Streptomyces sp. NTH33]PZH09535.1 DUF397 domain-containing protein [Streptomyces sp. NTH33]